MRKSGKPCTVPRLHRLTVIPHRPNRVNVVLVIGALNLGITAVLGALLYFVPSPLFNPSSVPFGVRIPPDRTDAPEIGEQRRRYGSLMLVTTAAVTLLAVVLGVLLDSVLPGGVGAAVLCVASAALWMRGHQAIGRAKEAGAWYDKARQGAVTDTSLRTDPVRFPWAWTAPSIVIIVVTAVAGAIVYPSLPDRLSLPQRSPGGTVYHEYTTTFWLAFSLVIAQVAATALMAGTVALILRARPDLDAAQPRSSASRYRRYLTATARGAMIVAALLNLMLLGLSGAMWSDNRSPWLLAVIIGVPVLASLVAAGYLVLRVGPAGSRLPVAEPEAPTGLVRRDDDRHWHAGGTVYLNADDPAVLVARRAGLGWTVNVGNVRFLVGLAVVLAVVAAVAAVLAVL